MKIVAMMPVRNEDWCLGLTARAALMWVDELVIGLHACTDRSFEIVKALSVEFAPRVRFIANHNPVWHEMSHRQVLLEIARGAGATHLAMIDADEILTGNLIGPIRGIVGKLVPGQVLQLPWLALPRSVNKYIAGGNWGNGQNVTTAFKDDPRWHWTSETRGGYDFHQRHPMVHGGHQRQSFHQPLKAPQGGMMHLQFLSERRLRAKQALYQMTEVIRWPGRKLPAFLAAMYGRAVYESDPTTVVCLDCPDEWWEPYAEIGEAGLLNIDAKPWQEEECKRLMAEHGPAKFKGLDLFGVV